MSILFPDSFTLPLPDDFHIHLRQGVALSAYARDAAASFGRVIVMPNTKPPVRGPLELQRYRRRILDSVPKRPSFTPLMTFKIAEVMQPEDVRALTAAGATAGKLYPAGATTNSEDGVSDIEGAYHVFEAMEAENLVLCIHGEDPQAFVLDREAAFLGQLEKIVSRFPRLRVVLEHVTTREAVELVKTLPDRVAATITVHHLLISLDDVIGGLLKPHLFCKPVAKRPEDRDALLEAALGGSPRFFFGSDSAPHPVPAKECSDGCAGVYSAPVAMPLLIDLFERHGSIDALRAFCCENGARFYRLAESEYEVTYTRAPWQVPERYGDVVPLAAGTSLSWTASVPRERSNGA